MSDSTTLPLDGERLLQIARDTGLRHHLHGVAPAAARELLTRYAEAVINARTPALLDAIDVAIAFGAGGINPPPAGHWLQRFWDIGRDQAAVRDQALAALEGVVRVADRATVEFDAAHAAIRALKGTPAAAVADQTAARNLAFDILMQVADEAPINGNELAQARVILAAGRLRDSDVVEKPDWIPEPDGRGMVLKPRRTPAAAVADAPPVAGADIAEMIVRDVCELDPANPNLNDTVCIDVSDLLLICQRHAAQPSAQAQPKFAKPFTASVMLDESGEHQAYCLMAAWRRKDDALAALAAVGGVLSDAQAQPSGNAGEVEPSAWQGWATQKPDRLPKLWGARHIAEWNWDEDGEADLIKLVEVDRIAASKGANHG